MLCDKRSYVYHLNSLCDMRDEAIVLCGDSAEVRAETYQLECRSSDLYMDTLTDMYIGICSGLGYLH